MTSSALFSPQKLRVFPLEVFTNKFIIYFNKQQIFCLGVSYLVAREISLYINHQLKKRDSITPATSETINLVSEPLSNTNITKREILPNLVMDTSTTQTTGYPILYLFGSGNPGRKHFSMSHFGAHREGVFRLSTQA